MQKLGVGTYTLMLSIILWGVLLGGIVYSHIVYFPVYLSALPDSAVLVTGKYALDESRFWLLIHPLAVLSLIISMAVNWKNKFRRKMIVTPLAVYLLVLVCTSLYFIPELMAFHDSAQSNISTAEWLARGNKWQYLSWTRGTIMFACIVPLLLGLAKPTSETGPMK